MLPATRFYPASHASPAHPPTHPPLQVSRKDYLRVGAGSTGLDTSYLDSPETNQPSGLVHFLLESEGDYPLSAEKPMPLSRQVRPFLAST